MVQSTLERREEGWYPPCELCGMQIRSPWATQCSHHFSAECNMRAEKWKVAATLESFGLAHEATAGTPIGCVSYFEYLGCHICPGWTMAIHKQLKKTCQRWAMIARPLSREGQTHGCQVGFIMRRTKVLCYLDRNHGCCLRANSRPLGACIIGWHGGSWVALCNDRSTGRTAGSTPR
jgi:hypothetical protein